MAQEVADLELGLGSEAVVDWEAGLEAGLETEDQTAQHVVGLGTEGVFDLEAGQETEDQTSQQVVVGQGTEAVVDLEAGFETEDRTAHWVVGFGTEDVLEPEVQTGLHLYLLRSHCSVHLLHTCSGV